MDRRYTHAGTRAKVMEYGLLNETQIERLVSAKDVKEVMNVLQDTFLAPYLNDDPHRSVTDALDQAVVDAKKTLTLIAPDPQVLHILWLKYDFHNLKTIVKGKRSGESNEAILDDCFRGGVFAPTELLKAFEGDRLQSLSLYFKDAVRRAEDAKHVFEIDVAMNMYYFKAIRDIADRSRDSFLREYVTLLINVFNVKAALRALGIADISQKDVFVRGGSLGQGLDSKKQILEKLCLIGGERLWIKAIEDYETSGDYTLLEKTSDEYLATYVKEQSLSIFTPASLFSYFTALKQHAQIIGSVLVAKRSGLSEKDLRVILRRVYA
jgi:V/A-type H+-transporting ATPase subunit C